jgi:hypothetical protein
MLRKEFREKITAQGIKNVFTPTIPWRTNSFYPPHGHPSSPDNAEPHSPIHDLPSCDIVVLDEVQDCSLLYYQFVVYFIKTLCKSDVRFCCWATTCRRSTSSRRGLPFPDSGGGDLGRVLKIIVKRVRELFAGTSYRITHQISDFINDVMIGENRISV